MVRSIQTLDPKELRSHLVRELEQIRERQISVLPLVFLLFSFDPHLFLVCPPLIPLKFLGFEWPSLSLFLLVSSESEVRFHDAMFLKNLTSFAKGQHSDYPLMMDLCIQCRQELASRLQLSAKKFDA